MTIMAQTVDFKRTSKEEAIHSGHFMVSSFEAEAQDDEDEVAVPVPEEVLETKALAVISKVAPPVPSFFEFGAVQPFHQAGKFPWNRLSIETSLTKLFQCMSLAYRQKLTSPKWNRFKGIRLRWKDKIRLNNVIWRCWHMQFIKRKNTLVCQFASPLDADTHNKPEAVVLEGKYWKRKLNAVTAEYKKWRLFSHNQILGKPNKEEAQDLLAEFEGQDWAICAADNSMMVDEDYMGLMSDTLFSTITANQPFAFPDTREIARGVNLADFIQPSLVQLQPNLDEFMDIEPLHDFLCSKLSTVPEEPAIVQSTAPAYQPSRLKVSTSASSLVQTSSYAPHSQFGQDASSLWFMTPPNSYEPPLPTIQSPPVQQQYHPPLPPVPPVPPPPPPASASRTPRGRKEDILASSKVKKARSRSEGSKKLATSSNTVISQSSSAVPTIQSTSTQIQPNNALLAQLLTNTSGATYGYFSEEHTPTKVIPKEEVSYIQQQPYKSIDNSGILYHSESDLNKQSFLINSEANSNSSTASHCSSISPPINSSVLVKSLQSSMGNQPGPSTSCPESPLGQDPLSLSPLNVGSPTSSSGKPAYREHRRVCHINAEQKRRCNIKNGFDTLHSLIPMLNQNPNIKMSKAAMLQKGADYILQLQNERQQLKQEMDSLKQQIETLNSDICNCQSMLPATGAPISKHRSNKMRDMYRKYVRVRVHENWKFWILSLICEPLLETFNNVVSTASMDELYRTTLQWVDQHCSLVDLRPIVLNALRHLCTTTEVLTDPGRLPIEARTTVDKAVKKS
ncbi:hypothetical protein GE061_002257 [Apolygus lucorum]|uniref:Uncharacterized protein n=1 Tax=Apolygus lucorum TaxID=248454 RepID=A0A6A4JJU9_APOLU|nr:hypothetical protein GE061_002257 [Apolygus lucorum]